ncbi:MAG: NAD(P)/FAD-dependent oxidoreductase [Euryarchaeota archaeon]|nr:NAD(P)/FAD-dependent oxidoreductase [Euryarchaeota archaeon]
MRYDAAVIGAGPAGSFAASRLSSLGYKTVMIDPCDKKKVCAGILTAQYVRNYGINEVFAERKLKGVRISFHGINAEINYKQAVEYSIDRQVYDFFNINEAIDAGSELRRDLVSSLHEKDSYVEIRTKKGVIIAEYVILASGISDLSRRFGGTRTYAFCVQQKKDTNPDDYFEMDLFKGGYSWIAPKRDHVLTGTSSTTDYPDIPGEKALIPVGGPVKRTYSRRILLVGDAAGFVSPFEGEGLYYARRSGEIAAEVLSGVMSGENIIEDYERWWKKEFDFSALNVISGLLSRDRVLELFVSEIRDNGRFNKLVENILTEESKKLAIKDVSSLLKKLI